MTVYESILVLVTAGGMNARHTLIDAITFSRTVCLFHQRLFLSNLCINVLRFTDK